MTVRSEILDDLALARLSRPATLPGGLSRRRFLQLAGVGAGAAAVSPLLSSLEAFA
ncbi:MAG: twin-arginine translocation signal domain-containing protein, partial [Acidimicrobiia bacterium]